MVAGYHRSLRNLIIDSMNNK
uniref:Uncharacterized protein n=1 Tax=Tetranychus urticae TaxID=32264 RepID=T1L6J5_TETUR